MATISTVKPLGGGDFTTLQAWEDFADDQVSADQWAECYAGGDLGSCAIAGWTATPDATNYPRIYTPLSERHEARRDTGAFLNGMISNTSNAIGFVRVEGLRIEPTGGFNYGVWNINGNAWLIDSNLFLLNTNGSAGVYIYAQTASITSCTIRNNIVSDGGTASGRGIDVNATAVGSNSSITVEIYNNTIVGVNQYGIYLRGTSVGFPDPADGDVTATVRNNVALDSGSLDYEDNGTNITISAASNNMSSDVTGDDWGASGAIISAVTNKQVVEAENFWRLRRSSGALNAGMTIGSFSDDALGNSRPGNQAWDMGAIEGPSSVPVGMTNAVGIVFQF